MNKDDILGAWLQELADVQPNFGPLLQSTMDKVGALPAAGGDDTIYTVGHERYTWAAGFSKAFMERLAKYKYADAMFEAGEAEDANDELTMAKKDDEARFWQDVMDWVASAGTARMRPAPVPAWITKNNIHFEP